MSMIRYKNACDILHLWLKIVTCLVYNFDNHVRYLITLTSLRFNHLMCHADLCAPQRKSDSAPIAPVRSHVAVFELAYSLRSLADRH